MLKLAVLASGRGSNLQAIVDVIQAGRLSARLQVVIADRPGAQALDRARRAGVPAEVLPPAQFATKADFFLALDERLRARDVDWIALAGFLRVLPGDFVERWRWRILNIHPSLLPAFRGLEAPAQALAHGVKVSGCTVHFVDEGVDTGPILLQAAVPVLEDDTVETLAARILAEEHRIYPAALQLVAEGRVRLEGRRARILPVPVATPGELG